MVQLVQAGQLVQNRCTDQVFSNTFLACNDMSHLQCNNGAAFTIPFTSQSAATSNLAVEPGALPTTSNLTAEPDALPATTQQYTQIRIQPQHSSIDKSNRNLAAAFKKRPGLISSDEGENIQRDKSDIPSQVSFRSRRNTSVQRGLVSSDDENSAPKCYSTPKSSQSDWIWMQNVVCALLIIPIAENDILAASKMSYKYIRTSSLFFYYPESTFYQKIKSEFKRILHVKLLDPMDIAHRPPLQTLLSFINYKKCQSYHSHNEIYTKNGPKKKKDRNIQCIIQFPIFFNVAEVANMRKNWVVEKWNKNWWIQYVYQRIDEQYKICANTIFTNWYEVLNLTPYVICIQTVNNRYEHEANRRIVEKTVIQPIQLMKHYCCTIKQLANVGPNIIIAIDIHREKDQQKRYFDTILRRIQILLRKYVNASFHYVAAAINCPLQNIIDWKTNMRIVLPVTTDTDDEKNDEEDMSPTRSPDTSPTRSPGTSLAVAQTQKTLTSDNESAYIIGKGSVEFVSYITGTGTILLDEVHLNFNINSPLCNSVHPWLSIPKTEVLMAFVIEKFKEKYGEDVYPCHINTSRQYIRKKCKQIFYKLSAAENTNRKVRIQIQLQKNHIYLVKSITYGIFQSFCRSFEQKYNVKTYTNT